jgi:hypothetical protein
MFEVNEQKFGIVNSFNINEYTTPLPDAETQAKALEDYQRKQAQQGKSNGKTRGRGRSIGDKVSPVLQPHQKQQRDMRSHSVSGAENSLAPAVASMFAAFSQAKPPMPPPPVPVRTAPSTNDSAQPIERGGASSARTNNSLSWSTKAEAPQAPSCGAHVAPAISFSFNRDEIVSCI